MASKLTTMCFCALAANWIHAALGGKIRHPDDVESDNVRHKRSSTAQIDLTCTGIRWCNEPRERVVNRAPRPEHLTASHYVYKKPKHSRVDTSCSTTANLPGQTRKRRGLRIAINLQWSNKVSQMRYITGYKLAIHAIGSQSHGFSVCFNNVAVSNANILQNDSHVVTVSYRYFCENDSCVELFPDNVYILTLISLPGNDDVDDDTSVTEIIKIPDCRDHDMRKTIHCAKRRRVDKPVSRTEPSTVEIPNNKTITSFSSSTGIGLTTFSITLGGIAFSIAFIGWITWGLNAKIGRRKHILFLEKISEDLDNPCSYAFQSLIYEIKKHELAEITYNRWETVKLIPDPFTWIRNATAKADVIIALASPQESNSGITDNLYFNDWVNTLIRNKTDETHSKTIVLVSFHLKKRDSWPDFCKRTSLHKFKLPEELKKLHDELFAGKTTKCPFNADEMTSLANEANMRAKNKTEKATKTVRSLLKIADDERPLYSAR